MLGKVTDAASMLWASLDTHERRMVVIAAVWVGATVYLYASERTETKQRDDLKAQIKAELRQEMTRA